MMRSMSLNASPSNSFISLYFKFSKFTKQIYKKRDRNIVTKNTKYLEAFVETPVNLSKKQKDLLKQFEEDKNQKSTSPKSEGFFSKLKDLWLEK